MRISQCFKCCCKMLNFSLILRNSFNNNLLQVLCSHWSIAQLSASCNLCFISIRCMIVFASEKARECGIWRESEIQKGRGRAHPHPRCRSVLWGRIWRPEADYQPPHRDTAEITGLDEGKWWKTVGDWKWSAFPGTHVDVCSTRIIARWKTGGSRLPLYRLLDFPFENQSTPTLCTFYFGKVLKYRLRIPTRIHRWSSIMEHHWPFRTIYPIKVRPRCTPNVRLPLISIEFVALNSEWWARECVKQRESASSLLILPWNGIRYW